MDRYARELEGLLSQRCDDDGPVDDLVRAVAAQKAPLVLYGAGSMGRTVLDRLRRCDVEPVAFADETPSKQGGHLDGVRNPRPFGIGWRAMATLFSPSRFSDPNCDSSTPRNACISIAKSVVSFLHLAKGFPTTSCLICSSKRRGN